MPDVVHLEWSIFPTEDEGTWHTSRCGREMPYTESWATNDIALVTCDACLMNVGL